MIQDRISSSLARPQAVFAALTSEEIIQAIAKKTQVEPDSIRLMLSQFVANANQATRPQSSRLKLLFKMAAVALAVPFVMLGVTWLACNHFSNGAQKFMADHPLYSGKDAIRELAGNYLQADARGAAATALVTQQYRVMGTSAAYAFGGNGWAGAYGENVGHFMAAMDVMNNVRQTYFTPQDSSWFHRIFAAWHAYHTGETPAPLNDSWRIVSSENAKYLVQAGTAIDSGKNAVREGKTWMEEKGRAVWQGLGLGSSN